MGLSKQEENEIKQLSQKESDGSMTNDERQQLQELRRKRG